MPQKQQDHAASARQRIDLAVSEADPVAAALDAQIALTHAVLAVAAELAGLRDKVDQAGQNLEDQDGYGAGMHLRNISDWLEKIAGRR